MHRLKYYITVIYVWRSNINSLPVGVGGTCFRELKIKLKSFIFYSFYNNITIRLESKILCFIK